MFLFTKFTLKVVSIISVEFERKSRKKRRWGRSLEYSSYERRYIFGDTYTDLKKKIEKSVVNQKAFTIQEVASANDIRVSVAKQMLYELENEGKIKSVSRSHRVKIFQGIKSE